MTFVSRTVNYADQSFEMFYEIHGDNLILKDVIPENKGHVLPDGEVSRFHSETLEMLATGGKLDGAEDEEYVGFLSGKGIVIIADDDEEE